MRPSRFPLFPSGAALAVILIAATGCRLQPIEEEIPLDAPTLLTPSAHVLNGAPAAELIVEAERTLLEQPLDTGLTRRVAEQAGKAVVSIYTRTREPYRLRVLRFVRVNLEGEALGSGFFIHPAGYVLTNDHVIRKAERIRARTRDGRDLELRVVARDPAYDLALLRAVGRHPPFEVLPMGDSDQVGVGDMVIAVGNPFGLGHTVTSGIISQTDRDLSGLARGEGRIVHYLQTDTAINPGSSGGPLITLTGAWVGVNTAGAIQGQGIGFAVPSRQAREFLEDVLAGRGEPAPRRR
jgi:S1-C subfamily serine protease